MTFKKKYRIVEKTRRNGKVKYHVEMKSYLWFSWLADWHSASSWKTSIFNTLEEALEFKEHKERRYVEDLYDYKDEQVVKKRVVG